MRTLRFDARGRDLTDNVALARPLTRAAITLVAIPMTMTFVVLSAAVLSGRALAMAIADALAAPPRPPRAPAPSGGV